jgi:hypothetical protein
LRRRRIELLHFDWTWTWTWTSAKRETVNPR